MQHPDLTSRLAGERQARYRSDAGRSRLTRPDTGEQNPTKPTYRRVADARRSAILRIVAPD